MPTSEVAVISFFRFPELRASDAEREATVAFLGRHYAEGRLGPAELSERVGAYAAVKQSELDAGAPSSMTEPSELTDLRNPRQFSDAYRHLAPLAFTAANRVLRDAAAAEDVVQDVFMQLWLRPSAFDPARGALSRYVTLLARSRAMDRWRSRRARAGAVERSAQESLLRPHAAESAAEPVIRRERSHRVLRALDGLPSDQREAVLLAYGRGLTAQEIARAAQVPLGTAKSRVRLGLEKAREDLTTAA